MLVSVIIAARNEGQALWKTVRSCFNNSQGLNLEIVVADDHSDDGSVTQLLERFPRVRLVRHETPSAAEAPSLFEQPGLTLSSPRQGAAATKDLGARHARGDVLIFLDGHCHTEPGAMARLARDVQLLEGRAVVTPTVTALDQRHWRCSNSQRGHGYFVDLQRLHCGWLPLKQLRHTSVRGRGFYESPALIGCAVAMHRDLYEYAHGFDPHMRLWGVEDLDFGLKAWLLGFPILHDPEAVVGHRFRQRFTGDPVPMEQLLANQLRMARKNFTEAVWTQWVDRCRARHPGGLNDPAAHPEGLWAGTWMRFEQDRPSAEHERSYLLANRQRDEFCYAQRFGLSWPHLQREEEFIATTARSVAALDASPSPAPSRCTLHHRSHAWPDSIQPEEDPYWPVPRWTRIATTYPIGFGAIGDHPSFSSQSCDGCIMDIQAISRAARYYREDPSTGNNIAYNGAPIGDQNDPRNFASLLLVKVCYTGVVCNGEPQDDYEETYSHIFYSNGLGTYIQWSGRGIRTAAETFTLSDPCYIGHEFIEHIRANSLPGDGTTPPAGS